MLAVQFMIAQDRSTFTDQFGKSVGPLYGFGARLLHGRFADINFIHDLISIFGNSTEHNFS